MTKSPQFKSYEKGKINSINVKAIKLNRGIGSLYKYNEKLNLTTEEVGIEYFKKNGYDAVFSENIVWNRLFKNLLYKKLKKEYQNKNHKKLSNLELDNEFYNNNEDIIKNILEELKYADLTKLVLKESNEEMRNILEIITKYLENDQIIRIMKFLTKDFKENMRGFPDLMVWNNNELFFSEVKARGDSLSPEQVRTHNVMLDSGINITYFSVNKKQSTVKKELKQYEKNLETEKRIKYGKNYYKDQYIYKIEKAKKQLSILEKNGYDISKLKNNDDYTIAYLNCLYKYKIKNTKRIKFGTKIRNIINEEKEVKRFRLMYKGHELYFADDFNGAIEYYKQIPKDSKPPYYKMFVCYDNLKEYREIINLIFSIFNDEKISERNKKPYKKRFKNYIDNDFITKTQIRCPNCENRLTLARLKNDRNSDFYFCDNENCNWYSGILNKDQESIESIINNFIQNKEEEKLYTENLSDEKLIKLAKEYQYEGNYEKAIELYKLIKNDENEYTKNQLLFRAYRRNDNLEEAINHCFKNMDNNKLLNNEKNYFKRKVNNLIKNNQHIEKTDTEYSCPKCSGKIHKVTIFHPNKDVKFYICLKRKCFWHTEIMGLNDEFDIQKFIESEKNKLESKPNDTPNEKDYVEKDKTIDFSLKPNYNNKNQLKGYARELEANKEYEEAAKIYESLLPISNKIPIYKRLCVCYKRSHQYEKEIDLTFNTINKDYIPEKKKKFFKTRVNKFRKDSANITSTKTEKKCPICGSDIIIKNIKKRDNIKFYMCDNEECFWYGGIIKDD